MAVIDILTRYGMRKRTAQTYKTVKHGVGAEISTVKPELYARRFLDFITQAIEWARPSWGLLFLPFASCRRRSFETVVRSEWCRALLLLGSLLTSTAGRQRPASARLPRTFTVQCCLQSVVRKTDPYHDQNASCSPPPPSPLVHCDRASPPNKDCSPILTAGLLTNERSGDWMRSKNGTTISLQVVSSLLLSDLISDLGLEIRFWYRRAKNIKSTDPSLLFIYFMRY